MTDAPRPALDRRVLALVVLLAVVVALPSITNGFAYDDEWVIKQDGRIHDLLRWREWLTLAYWPIAPPAMYRPLTTSLFALQWAVGDGAPWVFHAVNIALHAACTGAVLWLATLLLGRPIGAVVGAVFAVHPVHVEAIANGVGQSELTGGLTVLLGVAYYIAARWDGALSRRDMLVLLLLFVIGTSVKEHTFVLPALWGIAELTVLRRARPWREVVQTTWILYALATAVAVYQLWARLGVLTTLGGAVYHPVLDGLAFSERAFVMFSLYPEIARLFLWPLRLHADYSPAHVLVYTTPDVSQLAGVVLLALVIGCTVVAVRRSAVATLGIAIALLPWFPSSNLPFASGVLLAERTLYTPSAGVFLALGAVVAATPWRTRRRELMVLCALVLVAGSVRSILRAPVWRSNEAVFAALLEEQPLSFKAHFAWGQVLFDRGDYDGGMREWQMAIRIYPSFYRLEQHMGFQLAKLGRCDLALPHWLAAVEKSDGFPLPRAGAVSCQLALARYTDARAIVDAALADSQDPVWFRARRVSIDSALAALDSLR
jgi:hypothetical protein